MANQMATQYRRDVSSVDFEAARNHFVAMEFWACAREERLTKQGVDATPLTVDERHLEQTYRGQLLDIATRRLQQKH